MLWIAWGDACDVQSPFDVYYYNVIDAYSSLEHVLWRLYTTLAPCYWRQIEP